MSISSDFLLAIVAVTVLHKFA